MCPFLGVSPLVDRSIVKLRFGCAVLSMLVDRSIVKLRFGCAVLSMLVDRSIVKLRYGCAVLRGGGTRYEISKPTGYKKRLLTTTNLLSKISVF